MPYNPLSYLEYEEQDADADSHDLFGSDDNNDDERPGNVSDHVASSSWVNPATPILPSVSSSRNIASPIRATENAVASSSRHRPAPTEQPSPPAWKPPAVQLSGRPAHFDRSKELQRRIAERVLGVPSRGPPSLLRICQSVVEANASRIWDVGDVGYGLLEGLLKGMPLEQLAEVEANSPSLKKQTDWLWESFLIRDYAAAWEKARYKAGELRTSGWRRKYAEAMQEAEERKANAGKKLAERYQQIESERLAKRVVMVDKVVLPRGAKQPKGIPWRGLGPKPGTTGSGGGKAAGLIAKAKADVQRTRLGMIHASGRGVLPSQSLYKPKVTTTPHPSQTRMSVSLSGQPRSVDGPRIPPPKPSNARRNQTKIGPEGNRDSLSPAMPASTSPSSYDGVEKWSIPLAGHRTKSAANPIPGSYRTSDHINKESMTNSSIAPTIPARFKLEERKAEPGILPKTVVPEFVAPRKKRQSIDFFDQPSQSPHRPSVSVERLPREKNGTTGKRRRASSSCDRPHEINAAPPMALADMRSSPKTRRSNDIIDLTQTATKAHEVTTPPLHAPRHTNSRSTATSSVLSAREETAKIESVLFRKKARGKSRPVTPAV